MKRCKTDCTTVFFFPCMFWSCFVFSSVLHAYSKWIQSKYLDDDHGKCYSWTFLLRAACNVSKCEIRDNVLFSGWSQFLFLLYPVFCFQTFSVVPQQTKLFCARVSFALFCCSPQWNSRYHLSFPSYWTICAKSGFCFMLGSLFMQPFLP